MTRELFSENLRSRIHDDEWLICQDKYDPKENLKYESLFALSNGYLGIRGSHEEGTKITLPYLYINGVFDKSELEEVLQISLEMRRRVKEQLKKLGYSMEETTRISYLSMLEENVKMKR